MALRKLPHQFAPEVAAALDCDVDGAVLTPIAAPIVALESTIITHGMPYPQNVETARAVEAMVRSQGAIPATIAVVNGIVQIGLSDDQLEALGQNNAAVKLSRADFAFAIAAKQTGSTTVAATMMAAQLAGIRLFATGGIGGVHRGGEVSFDISADLIELAKTPVCVVAAGAKALLDLPKTLEVLETHGVPVVGYQSTAFPAFWSQSSGLTAPLSLASAAEIARFLTIREAFGGHGGELIANPVPQEAEIAREEIEPLIASALGMAEEKAIKGKAVTPFLLQEIYRQTGGRSLETNIALVLNNARLAAQIAVAYARAHEKGPAAP